MTKNSKWLTEDLKEKIQTLFGYRYSCVLSDFEIEEIARNLTGYIESLLKFTPQSIDLNVGKKQHVES